MKIEKVKSKLKKVFNRVMGVLLPVATLFVPCNTNALVVHAAENQNILIYEAKEIYEDKTITFKVSIPISEGVEIVGRLNKSTSSEIYTISLYALKNANIQSNYFDNLKGLQIKEDSTGKYEYTIKGDQICLSIPYKGGSGLMQSSSFEILSGNIKLFKTLEEVKKYASTGTGDYDIIKPAELEKGWYLKNVNGYVTADDSPSSEAGADATYIHFTWDTDNLQEGDLIEIKTHSYYKKIGGEKLSGFHDFITYSDGVSATSGEYSFSQYLPAKAWFNSLENKPLVFKEYDTTDYYIRPVRMGSSGVEKYGGWIHIGMGKRTTPTSSPWADPDNSGDYGDFNEDGDWITDEETTEKEGGRHGWLQDGTVLTPEDKTNPFTGTNLAGMFSYFFDFMKGIPSLLGDLPALVSSIIGFLPVQIIGFIGLGILVAIILRIVGR